MADQIKITSKTYIPPVVLSAEFTQDDRVKLNGIEALADVTDTTNVSSAVAGATTKSTIVDADTVTISDSASSNTMKRVTFSTIKSTLKSYFDTLYNKYVHPNHSGDVTSVADGATTISANVVGNTKLADVPTNTIKGRITSATGDPEDLTATQVRTILNVADGANNYVHPSSHAPSIITQDASNRFVTDTEKSTWNGKAGTAVATTSTNGLMSSTDKTKLDNVEANATADMTGSEILASIKTVDGTGSGLDADLLDGLNASAFAPSGYGLGTTAQLLSSGTDLNTVKTTGFYRINGAVNAPPRVTGDNTNIWHYVEVINHDTTAWAMQNAWEYTTGTMFTRTFSNATTWSSWKKVWTDSNDGVGSGLDSDTLDAQEGTYYLNRANHTGTQTASTISDFDVEVSNNTNVTANTNARHSHANKTVLDATTASFLTADETKLDGISNGANKVLDSTTNGNILIDGVETNVYTHPIGTNPHGTTATDVGLGNVPNVSTNNQTPTYTEAGTITALTSGETLTTAFGKIAKAVSTLISHIANVANPHSVTKAQVGLGSADNTADSAKNVLSATKLTTGRTINGVIFDGTQNITVADSTKVPTTTTVNGHALSGNVTVTASDVGLGNVNNTSDVNKPISTATQTALDGKSDTTHLHDDRYYTESEIDTTLGNYVTKPSVYITTTATTEGYYRIATIPITSQFKDTIFKIKGYTATGTTSESTIIINLAYYSGNYGSEYASILANNSHSYNSWTNAENGQVFAYCRVSFDATNAYIDMYKFKTTVVTMEVMPLTSNDWIWSTGVLAVNPTVGSYKNFSSTLYNGVTGNYLRSAWSDGSTYSQYGVVGTQTLSNTTDKTGQWAYFGAWQMDYNASYLEGKSGNIRIRIQEVCSDGTIVDGLDDFILTIKVGLGTHTDSTTFNSTIPTIDLQIDGKTTLTINDVVGFVYSTSTVNKYIRFYIKLKGSNTQYCINPEQRYGRSYTTSNAYTTSYCQFNLAGDQGTVVSLPTPAQGSIVYPTWKIIDADYLNGVSASEFAPINSPSFTGTPTAVTPTAGDNSTRLATTKFVSDAMAGAGLGDMLKSVYDTDNDGIVDNAEKVNGHTVGIDVPSNAVFTDTVYVHPTTSGYKHIPSGGASGQVLKYSADGTAIWGTDNDTIYTHPTTTGYKHIPSGGSSGQVLKWSADGTAVWGTDNDTIYTHPATHPYSMITGTPTSLPPSMTSVNSLDMNTITTTGFYYGYNMTNSASATISVFRVENYSADWIYQEQIVINADGTNTRYERTRYNGTTWGAWTCKSYNYGTTIPTSLNNGEVYYVYE